MNRRIWVKAGTAAGALFLAIICSGITAAHAANWLEMLTGLSGPRYGETVPPCDDPWALSRITARFAEKEEWFWSSPLKLMRFDNIRQVAFRPWHANTTPRRFCSARVLVSDGRWRPVHYAIIENGGTIGAVWGVDFCVVGLDRNWAYNPRCRMARP
jgi:hypothetical protein